MKHSEAVFDLFISDIDLRKLRLELTVKTIQAFSDINLKLRTIIRITTLDLAITDKRIKNEYTPELEKSQIKSAKKQQIARNVFNRKKSEKLPELVKIQKDFLQACRAYLYKLIEQKPTLTDKT